jgi:DNA-binding NtrC family response regulator
MPSILLIDDEADLRDEVSEQLVARGYAVECLDEPKKGLKRLAAGQFDVVLLDNKMPGMTGIEFLEALRDPVIEVPVILMTGESTLETAIQATKLRAFDYVIKPDTYPKLVAELLPIIARALEITKPVKEVRVSPAPAPVAGTELELVSTKNRRMVEEVSKPIARYAEGNDPVLIRGETGTGKELVARALHTRSPRKGKPFVALNCAAIPETLLESELFGHEANAFTGAKLRKGKIEYASGGTLFLDEIGIMPLNLQAKLLRVVEDQEVTRLGSNESIKVDVRFVSATNRNLEAAIEEGKFLPDLLFRLARVTIRLPPLRDRLDDLPGLVDYFLHRVAEATGRTRATIAGEALERLQAHRWTGNVRELQNVIFVAFGKCRGSHILPSDLDFPVTSVEQPTAEAEAQAGLHKAIEWAWANKQPEVWAELQKMLEEELVRFAHTAAGGNQSDVAKRLGMGRTKVVELIKKLGLR